LTATWYYPPAPVLKFRLSEYSGSKTPIPEPEVKGHPFAVGCLPNMKRFGLGFNQAKVSGTALYMGFKEPIRRFDMQKIYLYKSHGDLNRGRVGDAHPI